MSLKIIYKDGHEETLNGYDGCSSDEDGFVIFTGEDVDSLWINKDIIAKIK